MLHGVEHGVPAAARTVEESHVVWPAPADVMNVVACGIQEVALQAGFAKVQAHAGLVEAHGPVAHDILAAVPAVEHGGPVAAHVLEGHDVALVAAVEHYGGSKQQGCVEAGVAAVVRTAAGALLLESLLAVLAAHNGTAPEVCCVASELHALVAQGLARALVALGAVRALAAQDAHTLVALGAVHAPLGEACTRVDPRAAHALPADLAVARAWGVHVAQALLAALGAVHAPVALDAACMPHSLVVAPHSLVVVHLPHWVAAHCKERYMLQAVQVSNALPFVGHPASLPCLCLAPFSGAWHLAYLLCLPLCLAVGDLSFFRWRQLLFRRPQHLGCQAEPCPTCPPTFLHRLSVSLFPFAGVCCCLHPRHQLTCLHQ